MQALHPLVHWYPDISPYVQDKPKLLGKIREVRCQAAATIQTIAKEEFMKQSTKLNAKAESILNTVEGIWNGKKQSASLADRMDSIGSYVGHVISALDTKLQKRRKCLAQKQLSNADWDRFFQYCEAFHRTKTPPKTNRNSQSPRLTAIRLMVTSAGR